MNTPLTAALLIIAACAPPRLAALPPAHSSADEVNPLLPETARELSGSPLIAPGEVALYELRFRGIAIANVEISIGDVSSRDGVAFAPARARAEGGGIAAAAVKGFWLLNAEVPLHPTPETIRVSSEKWAVRYAGGSDGDERKRELRENRHHAISAYLALRRWAPRQGESASMKLSMLGRFELTMAAIDEPEIGVFRRETVHVVGRAKSSSREFPFELWISKDRDRIPLLVRAVSTWGKVELELLRYRAPT